MLALASPRHHCCTDKFPANERQWSTKMIPSLLEGTTAQSKTQIFHQMLTIVTMTAKCPSLSKQSRMHCQRGGVLPTTPQQQHLCQL
jgi:hypothetical protein